MLNGSKNMYNEIINNFLYLRKHKKLSLLIKNKADQTVVFQNN